jgi:transcription termination/antitermination protein NusG
MSLSPHVTDWHLPLNATAFASEDVYWFAVQTRSRHEKKVATLLAEKQIAAYLPLLKEVHRWSDRRKMVEQPLFPGYVFVRIPKADEPRIAVLRTSGVVRFVGIQGEGIPISDREIENVQTLISTETPYGFHPFLRAGQKVRIRGGYLDGVEGILVAKNSDQSVVVSVELIQRSLAIRVAGFDLENI